MLVSGVLGLAGCGSSAPTAGPSASRSTAATSAAGSPAAGSSDTTRAAAPTIGLPRSDARLLGQRIMVGFAGTAPSAQLLGAVRAGAVGGVILFGDNLASQAQSRALTSALQRAARSGGNPGLLISTDQEGGEIKRLRSAPPTLSPPAMAATGRPALADRQGALTAAALRAWGIDMDLAPVADVPTTPASFMARQGRTFSSRASVVSRFAGAFASGLQSALVAATAKHFPGIGSATVDTDVAHAEQLRPTAAQRSAALAPYRAMIGAGVDAVMVADAGFPAYDRSGAVAALSPSIIGGLLRGRLGFGGVVITDALGSNTGHDETTAGVLAARAGADVLLFSDGAPRELSALRAALSHGQISRAAAAASYRRIVALKRRLGIA